PLPFSSGPWQAMQYLPYTVLPISLRERPCPLFLGTSTMVSDQGSSLLFTYRMPVSGSAAAPPHSPPPSKPGKIHTPALLGGVNIALYLTWRNFSIRAMCFSGVMPHTSEESNCCRAKGSGSAGIGCVGQGASPGRSEGGTATS